jgi:excisionase family DNA binding protein
MSINSTGLGDLGRALVVKPRTAWKMLQCSNSRGYQLIKAGELESFRDGRSRKITVRSIEQYIARRLRQQSRKGASDDSEAT